MAMTREEIAELFKQLDVECYNCDGHGKIVYTTMENADDCDICYGTGYQPTQAGVELLNFLRRQRQRIERERV